MTSGTHSLMHFVEVKEIEANYKRLVSKIIPIFSVICWRLCLEVWTTLVGSMLEVEHSTKPSKCKSFIVNDQIAIELEG